MLFTLHIATILFLGVAYLSIIYGALFTDHKNNPVSWILWFMLDIPALIGTLRHGDDPTLTLTFVIGTAITAVVLVIKGGFKWTGTETFTCVLVAICFTVTKVGTPIMILWATAFALTFAGIPWFNYLRKKTTIVDLPTKIAAIFFLIAMVSSAISTNMKDQSLVIPLNASVYWIVGVCLAFKKEFKFT